MILGMPARPGLRILLACQPVDFRRYAERTVMRSPSVNYVDSAAPSPGLLSIILRPPGGLQHLHQFVGRPKPA